MNLPDPKEPGEPIEEFGEVSGETEVPPPQEKGDMVDPQTMRNWQAAFRAVGQEQTLEGFQERVRAFRPTLLEALSKIFPLVLVLLMFGNAAGQSTATDFRPLVSKSYLDLYWWTSTKDPTDQSAAVKVYSKAAEAFILQFESALVQCSLQKDPTVDLGKVRTAWANAWVALAGTLDSHAEKALLREHGRYSFEYVTRAEQEILAACGNSPPVLAHWTVTTSGFTNVATGTVTPAGGNDPVGRCVAQASAGDLVHLAPGRYKHFSFDFTDKGPPSVTVEPEVPDTVVVTMNPVGGSDTVGMRRAGSLTLKGIIFECDDRSIVMHNTKTPYRALEFIDCKGGLASGRFWDAATDSGFRGKWGLLTYELDRFVWDGGEIIGIGLEHAMYHHNPFAQDPSDYAIVVTNGVFRHCQRTAFQVVSRVGEGPPGQGKIKYANNYVEDVCIGMGGQGSAITLRGGMFDMVVEIENNTVLLGCTPGLHPNVQGNITGCFVNDIGTGSHNKAGAIDPARSHHGVKDLFLTGNHFEVGKVYPGTGGARRTNCVVKNCARAVLADNIIINHPGAHSIALEIADTVDLLELENNTVVGKVKFRGVEYADYDAFLAAATGDPRVIIR